ncbi:MAG: class I SAM-dependent methyltransferase [Proteobacteria bacterium]|nr:class I SAM-dependent methyltransferase [Pseudomonadota bacterium]MBU1547398.1 class I SAM-dependent methyltransferase [Pseudomonadota bacterium]MBU2618994.1 class I SAM-dependent methyltransferase [Pseudomonadota bacterium]
MDLLANIWLHIQDKGVVRTISIVLNRMFDFYFDWKYKTDTRNKISLHDLTVTGENKARGSFYQPTMALSFNRLLDRVPLPPDSVLVDFGCGKGRVLLLAVLRGIGKAVGIEFSPELCAIARNNIKIVEQATGSRLDITVVEGDVTQYEIEDDQNVFFLFNPFDDVVLEAVVKNIQKSLQRKPREIVVIYYNPVYSHILDNAFLPKNSYLIGGEEYMHYVNC